MIKRTRLLAIAGLLAVGGFAAPGIAQAADPACIYNTCTSLYSGWDGAKTYDGDCDGNVGYGELHRESGTYSRWDTTGCGTTAYSGTNHSNLVNDYRACQDLSLRPDICSQWEW
ncbi:hypothetical protein GA0074692_5153 [Micromonospora pallida]|uniref:Uncharacterized protein n=1 Tax=Micromonospora pallida TaxID=145854 RepID=A0A1C6TBB2_9ACTN|nr:hypothetical protein [Micromonospora pallida]SCL38842.1 hypothetical protein GA0074692_5153 [Micromonospora pallida]